MSVVHQGVIEPPTYRLTGSIQQETDRLTTRMRLRRKKCLPALCPSIAWL